MSAKTSQPTRSAAPFASSKKRELPALLRDLSCTFSICDPKMPASVFVVGVSRSLLTALEIVLGEKGIAFRSLQSAQACREQLQKQVDATVVTMIPTRAASRECEELLTLCMQFPHTAWVAVFVDGVSDVCAVARFGKAGVTEIVASEKSPDVAPSTTSQKLVHGPGLLAALARGERDSVALRVWKLASLAAPDAFVTLLKPALRLAHAPISLPVLAEATCMHERSLRKFCKTAHLPSPQWIAGWARLLIASYYLDEPGRKVQAVSDRLGYATPALLANHIRRYTGMTATKLRQQGAVATTARILESHLFSLCQDSCRMIGAVRPIR